MRAQRGPASLTVLLRYTGSQPLVDLKVTVCGEPAEGVAVGVGVIVLAKETR